MFSPPLMSPRVVAKQYGPFEEFEVSKERHFNEHSGNLAWCAMWWRMCRSCFYSTTSGKGYHSSMFQHNMHGACLFPVPSILDKHNAELHMHQVAFERPWLALRESNLNMEVCLIGFASCASCKPSMVAICSNHWQTTAGALRSGKLHVCFWLKTPALRETHDESSCGWISSGDVHCSWRTPKSQIVCRAVTGMNVIVLNVLPWHQQAQLLSSDAK